MTGNVIKLPHPKHGVKLWNSLHTDLTNCRSLQVFKNMYSLLTVQVAYNFIVLDLGQSLYIFARKNVCIAKALGSIDTYISFSFFYIFGG